MTDSHPFRESSFSADERIFPAPWRFDEIREGYRVLDANGIVLAYVVARDPSVRGQASGLTRDEARRIAGVISSMPAVLKKLGG
jgi:hypothetical protein